MCDIVGEYYIYVMFDIYEVILLKGFICVLVLTPNTLRNIFCIISLIKSLLPFY
jgi:hypothetical protein